jgi:beta-galactosidase
MLPHSGTDSRVWREVKSLGAEFGGLDDILASLVQAEAAILIDWESWWALELNGKPSNDLRLLPQLMSYYAPLFKRSIAVDFAHPEADLSRYKLVIAPNLYLVNERAAENLNRYVEQGGNLVMSFFSGIVDEHEHVRLGGYPAPFREMLGLVVEEHVPYSETQSNTLCTNDGKQFESSFWSDVIYLKGAQALATYEQEYYAGSPAITRNQFGTGAAFYVGTAPDRHGMEWLLDEACKTAGINGIVSNLPAGVELVHRTDGAQTWLFALNYSNEEVTIPLDRAGYDVLTGMRLDTSLRLAPMDLAIIRYSSNEE